MAILVMAGRSMGVPKEATMPAGNVMLTDRQSEFVEEMVLAGRYRNASEVLRDGLRLVEERQRSYEAGRGGRAPRKVTVRVGGKATTVRLNPKGKVRVSYAPATPTSPRATPAPGSR